MKTYFKQIMLKIPYFKKYFELKQTKIPLVLKDYIVQTLKRQKYYWPIHKNSIVTGNVKIGINTSAGATPGCYLQGLGEIEIGNYTLLAPNVGIISSNHDIYNYRIHKLNKVKIGNYCWIGMNSVILPGVILGNHVIVGANSVVTKSFEEGYCVIGGNPAKILKKLEKTKTIDYRDEHEFIGFRKIKNRS